MQKICFRYISGAKRTRGAQIHVNKLDPQNHRKSWKSKIFAKSRKSDFRKISVVEIFFWKENFVVQISTTDFFFQKKIPTPQNIRKLNFEGKNRICENSRFTSWYPDFSALSIIFAVYLSSLIRRVVTSSNARAFGNHYSISLQLPGVWNKQRGWKWFSDMTYLGVQIACKMHVSI